MNERIHLRFADFDPARARDMVEVAHRFATEFIDRPHGERRAVVYTSTGQDGSWRCAAWWTAARAVVVRELEP